MTRTVLITGANRGIGLETARQLASRGDSVILTSRDEANGKAPPLNAARRPGRRIPRLDVTDAGDIAGIA